jgi:hypothetical protein
MASLLEITSQIKAPETDRARKFINDILMEYPLLQDMRNLVLDAFTTHYRASAGGQTLQSRAVAADFTKENLSQATLQSLSQKIVGFKLMYDRRLRADHDNGVGVDVDTWLDKELEQRAYDIADEIINTLFAADGTGSNFNGIVNILDGSTDIPGLGITGVIDASDGGSTSLDLSSDANYDLFLERLDKWKKEVRNGAIIVCNESLHPRITTIARHKHAYSWDKNEFGVPIERVNLMPIYSIPDSAIPNNEDDNAGTPNTDTTSLYILANTPGHDNVFTNSGLSTWDLPELDDTADEKFEFEFSGAWGFRTKKSVRRVRNIKI